MRYDGDCKTDTLAPVNINKSLITRALISQLLKCMKHLFFTLFLSAKNKFRPLIYDKSFAIILHWLQILVSIRKSALEPIELTKQIFSFDTKFVQVITSIIHDITFIWFEFDPVRSVSAANNHITLNDPSNVMKEKKKKISKKKEIERKKNLETLLEIRVANQFGPSSS